VGFFFIEANMKGYVKLRRGLLEHIKVMSFSELKVYIGLLLLANFKNGYVNITISNLCDTIGTDYKNTLNSIHRLEKFGYVKYTPAKNQWKESSFEITKYNAYGNNTEAIPQAIPEAIPQAIPQANDTNSNNTNELQLLKKSKEVKRSQKNIDIPKGISNTNQIFNHFCFKYKEVFNKDYIASFAKDKKILKDLSNKIPIETLKELVDIFLTTPDQFCENAGYTIGIFKIKINSLRIDKLSTKVSNKTVKSIIAAKNWLKKSEVIDVRQK
jgi:hypothetical protein